MLLTGAAEAVAEAERVQGAVAETAATTKEANAASASSAASSSRASQRAERSTSRLGRAHQFLGRAAMWGAGILGVGSVLALKAAYDHTQALGIATQRLSLQTGMNTRQASKWVEITQARGIQATTLGMGMSTLSKNIQGANLGTQTSIDLFKRWGITMKDLKNLSTEEILMKVADAMQHTNNVAGRAADIKTLFGRSGTQLLPLMSMGSKGIREQLGQAGGIDKDQLAQIMETRSRMRELGLAVQDLKNKLAIMLIPVIMAVVQGLLSFAQGLEHGHTWALAIAAAIGVIVLGLGLAAAAWVAVAAAEGLALGWPVLAIAAIALGFYELYQRVALFRTIVDAVFGFFKAHWPLLVSILLPILLPLALIIKHFRTIKSVAMGVFNWIKGAVHTVAHAISSAFGSVAGAVKSAFLSVVNGVIDALNWLIGAFNAVFDRSIDPPGPGPAFHGIHLDEIGHVGAAATKPPRGVHGPLAEGGVLMRGSGTVGEVGMERIDVLPGGGVRVTPLESARPIAPPRSRQRNRGGRGRRGDVYLDRRKVGEVLHDWTLDELARS